MKTDKFLFLKFRNAGFFRDQSRTSDFMHDIKGRKARQQLTQYIEPITIFHISNMLCVLMGERPSPSLRQSFIPRNEDIFNITKNGYLKIDTFKSLNKVNGKEFFPEETITIRKSVYDSWSTAPTLIHWERIRRLISDELYTQFINIMNEILNVKDVRQKFTALEGMELVRKNDFKNEKLTNFISLLKGKTPMLDFINSQQKPSKKSFADDPLSKGNPPTFNKNPLTAITTNFGVDKITRLTGEIIIPISDSDVEKIKNNKGFATLLDGGFVWINKVVDVDDMYETMLDGFTKINTLSTETKKTNQFK